MPGTKPTRWPLVALLALLPLTMPAQTIIETTLPESGHPLTVALPDPAPDPGAPIVVSLHYGGVAVPYYGRALLEQVVAPGLGDLGAVMVAPDCPAPAWAHPICTADVLAAIDHAARTYGADPARVLLAGYSKGGIGAWALSDAHPERFAGVLVMAGRAGTPRPGTTEPVPAYVIHGALDELFTLDAVRGDVEARVEAGQDVTLGILPDATHYDTGAFVAPLEAAAEWFRARAGDRD